MKDELITREELANRLKVKPLTIKRWEEKEEFPVYRVTKQSPRYNYEEVLAWMQKKANGRKK